MLAIKIISVIIGLFFGASLLSGSSLSCTEWYAAPHEFSVFIVTAIVQIALMLLTKKILTMIFIKKK